MTNSTDPTVIDETPEGLPKHIFVDEVVRNKNIKYFQVPKLGSYLAIKLQYDSCLFEEAYDAAVINYTETNEKVREQDIARKEYEEEMKERDEEDDNEPI